MSDISSLIGALFSDALTATSSTVTNLGGATLASVLSAVMERRTRAARKILLEEIRLGQESAPAVDIDESVAIVYRYWRATQEGTGRLNLRLLASVYAGQVRDRTIVANEFLYYADLLASLRRNEIILLGTFLRHSTNSDGTARLGHVPMNLTREELVPAVFSTAEDYKAVLGALLRTGLISADAVGGTFGGGSTMIYQVTNLLRELNRLSEIEGVVRRDHVDAIPETELSGHHHQWDANADD